MTFAGVSRSIIVPSPRRPLIVRSPALRAAVDRHGARIEAARLDRSDAARQADHVHRRPAIHLGPVAQLAAIVVAPALDAARRQQRAGVRGAG